MTQNLWALKGFLQHQQMRRSQLVSKFLQDSSARIILDMGCGDGFVSSFISQEFTFVVGLDIDATQLQIAKNKVKKVEFVLASIEYLPFRANSFEATCLLEIFEHLPNKLLFRAIHEIDFILCVMGILLVSVPYKEKIVYIQDKMTCKFLPRWGHLQSFDEFKVNSLLPSNFKLVKKIHLPNFGIISCLRILKPLPLKIWLLINKFLGMIRTGYWIILEYVKIKK